MSSRRVWVVAIGAVFVVSVTVQADLSDQFTGFDTVWGIGVSGEQSSYADAVQNSNVLPDALPTYDAQNRVSYPNGVGTVPSPGGANGAHFDMGAMGVMIDEDNLVVRTATSLDPQSGWYYSGWKSWFGVGDVFVSVEDTTGVSQYALLNTWARNGNGDLQNVGKGNFATAADFHVGSDLEGHLVQLNENADVARTAGPGSYHGAYYGGSSNAPDGLDVRVFAQGGNDLGDAGLTIETVEDDGMRGEQTWYIQTWTLATDMLSLDDAFSLGLHQTVTCGNDQMGMTFNVPAQTHPVPEPGTALLAAMGLGIAGYFKKRLG